MSSDHAERPISVRGTEIVPGRSGSHPSSETRAHHARLDGPVRRPARRRRARCSRSTRSRSTPSASSSPTSKASRSGRPSGGRSREEINQGIRDVDRARGARASSSAGTRRSTGSAGRLGDDHHRRLADAGHGRRRQGRVHLRRRARHHRRRRRRSARSPQKNIELQGLLERIRELDEIKTQFFANVSHELRTPLALILGPAQRLIDDDGTMEPRAAARVGRRSSRATRACCSSTSTICSTCRSIEARKLKIELQDTDVAALVRFLASHFAVLAAERDDRVRSSTPTRRASPPSIRTSCSACVMNLLGNAFKFVPARRPHSLHACVSRRRELAVAVDDSGPGVPPELRQAIFERFRQGDGGINRKAAGTGLGLAIAKEFVEMHKGRIEVLDSDLGGARFVVTLPLNRVDAGAAAAGGSGPRPRPCSTASSKSCASPCRPGRPTRRPRHQPRAGRACSSSKTTPT